MQKVSQSTYYVFLKNVSFLRTWESVPYKRSQHASPLHKMHFFSLINEGNWGYWNLEIKGKKVCPTHLPLKFTSDYNKDPDVPLGWIKIQKHWFNFLFLKTLYWSVGLVKNLFSNVFLITFNKRSPPSGNAVHTRVFPCPAGQSLMAI